MTDLTPEQEKECRDIFEVFDKNGSGSIDRDEIVKVMQGLGLNPTPQQADDMLKKRDLDGNGVITYDEFVAVYRDNYKEPRTVEEELKAAFQVFDKDGNGVIDRKELKQTLLDMEDQMEEDEIDAMMEEADTNKDGKINYDEFSRVMMGSEQGPE